MIAQAVLQSLAKASAQSQSNRGFQHHLVFAFAAEFQPANAIEVHDDRAVNADKLLVTQVPLSLTPTNAQP
jgi:hypothetical protein